VKCVEPRHADDRLTVGNGSSRRRIRGTEDEFEVWSDWSEVFGAPESEIRLKSIFQQKDTE
jgi:hypothetical protein